MDETNDAAKLADSAWRERAAQAQAFAILKYLGIEPQEEEDDMKVQLTPYPGVPSTLYPDGVIFNFAAVHSSWWLDLSHEYAGKEIKVTVFLNDQHKPPGGGVWGKEFIVKSTSAAEPGLHKQFATLFSNLSEWMELSVHASKYLTVVVGT